MFKRKTNIEQESGNSFTSGSAAPATYAQHVNGNSAENAGASVATGSKLSNTAATEDSRTRVDSASRRRNQASPNIAGSSANDGAAAFPLTPQSFSPNVS
jgi:hypothetical protein